MTSTDHRPPLPAVYPPQHDDRSPWQLDRRRFAAFLTAKDLVLGYTRTATEGAGRLAARLRLGGVFMMVCRSYGWLLGADSIAARGLRAPGVLAGLVWGLTTNVGQTLMGKAVRAVSTAVSTVGGAVGTAARWTLRLFGSPGARLASWLGSKATAGTQAATDRAGPAAAAPQWAAAVAEPASQGSRRDRPGTPATDPGRALPAPPLVLAGPDRLSCTACAAAASSRRRAGMPASPLRPAPSGRSLAHACSGWPSSGTPPCRRPDQARAHRAAGRSAGS